MSERVLFKVIRAVREQRGLTQDAFARLLGVSRPVVVRWESGAHPMSEATLDKAAQALGVSVRELLTEGLADDDGLRRKANR